MKTQVLRGLKCETCLDVMTGNVVSTRVREVGLVFERVWTTKVREWTIRIGSIRIIYKDSRKVTN